jgi:hypothetical protein
MNESTFDADMKRWFKGETSRLVNCTKKKYDYRDELIRYINGVCKHKTVDSTFTLRERPTQKYYSEAKLIVLYNDFKDTVSEINKISSHYGYNKQLYDINNTRKNNLISTANKYTRLTLDLVQSGITREQFESVIRNDKDLEILIPPKSKPPKLLIPPIPQLTIPKPTHETTVDDKDDDANSVISSDSSSSVASISSNDSNSSGSSNSSSTPSSSSSDSDSSSSSNPSSISSSSSGDSDSHTSVTSSIFGSSQSGATSVTTIPPPDEVNNIANPEPPINPPPIINDPVPGGGDPPNHNLIGGLRNERLVRAVIGMNFQSEAVPRPIIDQINSALSWFVTKEYITVLSKDKTNNLNENLVPPTGWPLSQEWINEGFNDFGQTHVTYDRRLNTFGKFLKAIDNFIQGSIGNSQKKSSYGQQISAINEKQSTTAGLYNNSCEVLVFKELYDELMKVATNLSFGNYSGDPYPWLLGIIQSKIEPIHIWYNSTNIPRHYTLLTVLAVYTSVAQAHAIKASVLPNSSVSKVVLDARK